MYEDNMYTRKNNWEMDKKIDFVARDLANNSTQRFDELKVALRSLPNIEVFRSLSSDLIF